MEGWMSESIAGPQEGALLPDFTMHFRDGRVLHRRELKGRSHAAIYFPPERPGSAERATRDALAARLPAWRAARATVLIVLPAAAANATEPLAFDPALDRDGSLRACFGVGPGGALFVADRYGEIALRADGAVDSAGVPSPLPLDEVAPTLELLEMRCSL